MEQPTRTPNPLRRHVDDLRLLSVASERSARCSTLSTGLQQLLQDALSAVGTDKGLLSLFLPEEQELRVRASSGLNEAFLTVVQRVPAGVGACGTCLQAKHRVVVKDVELDPIFEKYREAARTAGFRACHSVPLFDRDNQIVGVLTALFNAPHAPDERESYLLDLYGQMAAGFIERMQAEADDRNLRTLPEENSAGVIRVSAKGVVIYANHHGKPLLACWKCGLSGPVPLHLRDWINDILHSGQSRQIEEICGPRTFTLTAVPFPELEYTTLYAFEITQHKKAGEVLRKSREQLRLFIEQAPAALAMFDRDMRYLAVSARWIANYGLPQDLLGQWHYEVFPDLPEKWKEVHQRALAGEVLRVDEDSFTRANGTVHWEQWEARPWTDEEGKIGGILIFTENITERKIAEQALRSREKELSLIFQNASDILYYLAVEAPGCYRFVAVNEAFLRATGLPKSQVVGKTVQEVIPEASLPRVLEKYNQALQTGETVRWEQTSEYPAGRKTGLVVVTPLLKEDGQCGHLFGTVHDISEQKRAEEQLKLVADHAPCIISYIDSGLIYRFNNAAYNEWFGFPPLELAGRPVAQVLGKELFYNILPYIKRALQGERVRFETKAQHRQLGLRHTEVTYIPDQAPDGPVRGFYVFVYDITERNEETGKLRETQEKFQGAAAHSALTLFEQNTDLRYTWIYPLTPLLEKSLGKTDLELLPNEDGQLLVSYKKEVIRSGTSQRRQIQISSMWSETKYYDLIMSPKRDRNGNIIGISGTALDITDSKRA